MKLESIRIVLVATSHPGNIGATARAMKTMGLSRLYLVSPQCELDRRAHEMAAGADDILLGAVTTQTLPQALEGCQLVLGTSARPRALSLPGLVPEQAAQRVMMVPDNTDVALVFGREHAGLTNPELLHCHYHVHIPSNPAFSSLNLAQSVQILAYEMRMKALNPSAFVEQSQDALATAEQIEQFHEHLASLLIKIDFLKASNPKRLLQRLRRLFNRTQLESKEINILRGILTHLEQHVRP
ncbi:MAG: RNA methyltransferase [Legionellaceae bacterium]